MCEIEFAKRLSDEEVLLLLERGVRDERELTAQVLVHFGEVHERGLFRAEGYSSMFDYAVRGLHMSEGEANLRMRAARVVRRFPQALEMLKRGELHLTALRLLSSVLNEHNTELLNLARHKTKLEVERLIAAHFPKPDVRSEVRKLPARAQPAADPRSRAGGFADRTSGSLLGLMFDPDLDQVSRAASDASNGSPSDDDRVVGVATPDARLSSDDGRAAGVATPDGRFPSDDGRPAEVATPDPRLSSDDSRAAEVATPNAGLPSHDSRAAGVTVPSAGLPSDDSRAGPTLPVAAQRASRINVQAPLSEGRYKVQFTASERVNNKLEQAKELLRREVPSGDLEVVFERALDLLIADRKKKMFGLTDKPRARAARAKMPSEQARSPYVPRELRRQVYARDNGQCVFEAANGTRCSARARLEVHHILAFELGGSTTLDNLQLRCRAHNVLEAERDFGRDTVLRRIQGRRAALKSSRPDECFVET